MLKLTYLINSNKGLARLLSLVIIMTTEKIMTTPNSFAKTCLVESGGDEFYNWLD